MPILAPTILALAMASAAATEGGFSSTCHFAVCDQAAMAALAAAPAPVRPDETPMGEGAPKDEETPRPRGDEADAGLAPYDAHAGKSAGERPLEEAARGRGDAFLPQRQEDLEQGFRLRQGNDEWESDRQIEYRRDFRERAPVPGQGTKPIDVERDAAREVERDPPRY